MNLQAISGPESLPPDHRERDRECFALDQEELRGSLPVALLESLIQFPARFREDFLRRYPDLNGAQTESSKLRRICVGTLPFAGPLSEISDARKKFHRGIVANDESIKEAARIECLLALSKLGVDCTVLSAVKLELNSVSKIGQIAGLVSDSAAALKIATEGGDFPFDLLSPIAKRALEIPRVRSAVDHLLLLESEEVANTLLNFVRTVDFRFQEDLRKRFPG